MMRLSVVCQRTEEVVLKVEGRIHLLAEAGVLTQEGQRWLKQGKGLVLELAGLQAIGAAGLAVLQWWAGAGSPVVLRGGSGALRALLRFHGLPPEEDAQLLQGWPM
jgi:ABC-type transporter Mla MlaB component